MNTRRSFITLLGGAAAAWPVMAPGQQVAMPIIGFLNGASPDVLADAVAAFRLGLKELGYAEGRNVKIEFLWADNEYQRLPAMAEQLVRRQVALIVAGGTVASALAAQAATATIPIVFSSGADPVKFGLVTSLGRPGGNLTGAFTLTNSLEEKRLEVLHELAPTATVIAVLVNPKFPNIVNQVKDIQAAAHVIGKQTIVLHASSESDIEAAFARLTQEKAGALLVASDPFLFSRRDQLIRLAASHAVPAVYQWRRFVEAGGLMSYGTNLSETYRPIGVYAGRILKGEKPSDLPVVQSTKVELVINLKTAKALGLAFPPTLLARADEVIE